MNCTIFSVALSKFTNYPRAILLPSARYIRIKSQPKAEKEKNEKLIKIAIIGVPNAGKSTLINSLVDHRVSIFYEN